MCNGGVRSYSNAIITVAGKFPRGAKSSSLVKKFFQSSSTGVNHDAIAKNIDLFNENKPKFMSFLAQTPREFPLKDALELIKCKKLKLKGYYYISDENSFYPIVSSDDRPGNFKVPKGSITESGFVANDTEYNGLFEVLKVNSRSEIKIGEMKDTSEQYERMSKIFLRDLRGLTGENKNYNENELGFLNLASMYSRDLIGLKDVKSLKDFKPNDDLSHKNAFTLFSADFSDDGNKDFDFWLNKNYENLSKHIETKLRDIRKDLISQTSESSESISTKFKSLSLEQGSSTSQSLRASSGLQSSSDDYERQGARPKQISIREGAEGFEINKSTLRKSLKMNSMGVQNVNDKDEEKEPTVHGVGYFKLAGTENYIEKVIYSRQRKIGEKDFEEYFVKQGDKEAKVLEVNSSAKIYSYILSDEEAKVFEEMNTEIVIQAVNRDGDTKKIIPQKMVLEDGSEKTLAYQLEDGLWREIILSPDGKYYLGEVVKYEGISSKIRGKLRKLAKVYQRYGSPIVSGASSISKTVSGLTK